MIAMRSKVILFAALLLCVCAPSWSADVDELINFSKKQEDVFIIKVVDTDQVVLENGQRLMLIGIRSAGKPPRKFVELDKNGRVIENTEKEATIPLEEQALTYAQEIMEGKKVRIEYDIQSRDLQGRRLVYVFLPDGRLANAELLRQGFVYLEIRPPNLKHADALRSAYQEAKREQRGLLSD